MLSKEDLKSFIYQSNRIEFGYHFIRRLFVPSLKTVGYFIESDKKIIFLSTPKVASTSIKNALFGAEDKKGTGPYKGIAKEQYEVVLKGKSFSGKKYEDYFKFSFVRNPFDRLVSCYEYKYHSRVKKNKLAFGGLIFLYLEKERGFHEFARRMSRIPLRSADKHFAPQSLWIFDPKGNSRVDYIGKFENLEQDWKPIMEKYGLTPLPHFNKSKDKNWMDYYDRKTAELVYKYYKKDIQQFGYEDSYRELLHYIECREKEKRG